MTSRSKSAPATLLEHRDLADYGVARLRDQIFDAVSELWRRRRAEGWTQKKVAEAIARDPGWVSRNLRAPGNWTLRTAGELVQALNGQVAVSVTASEKTPPDLRNYDAYDGYMPAGGTVRLHITSTGTLEAPPIRIDAGSKGGIQLIIGVGR